MRGGVPRRGSSRGGVGMCRVRAVEGAGQGSRIAPVTDRSTWSSRVAGAIREDSFLVGRLEVALRFHRARQVRLAVEVALDPPGLDDGTQWRVLQLSVLFSQLPNLVAGRGVPAIERDGDHVLADGHSVESPVTADDE